MCTNTHYGQPENHSDTQTNGWYEVAKVDGFLKKSDICVTLHPSSLRSTHKYASFLGIRKP
jgi:phosphoglycerate dehydrogenase-like enzyme